MLGLLIALFAAGEIPASLDAGQAPAYKLLRPGLAVAGQPSTQLIGQLKELGFRTVVDLRTESEGLDAERKSVESQGLRYVSVPFSADTFALEDALRVGRVLEDAQAGPVLVHCASSNRVGGVWAVLQARSGKSLDEAIEAGRQAGLKSDAMIAAVKRVLEAAPPAKP